MNEFIRGIKKGFPICLGYIPVSFTFGLIAVKMGFNPLEATIISMTNMASAGQFAGIRLIEGGAPYIELVITTFVINLRYMLMSLSLSQKVASDMPFYKRAVMAFCITDEVFALAAMEKDDVSFPFFGGLMTTPIAGWTLGTFLGAVASSLLSPMLQGCFGIALYCMFIAIIIPPARKGRKVAIAVVVSALLSCLFKYVPGINVLSKSGGGGWAIIVAAILGAAICASIKEIKRFRRRLQKGGVNV
ncbi:MAG: AzlC family ABC transporter permease [Bacteroidales bacterium]|jgi:4-azaleucine resistance transporter AzlC|nr:AzlC family ABC transporter permease [Bacteroidales bacterium]MCR5550682.1 AzlC family ABC transporter permease [Bacteroidales bacterium]